MQHAADFRKFTIRVNDRTYEFSNLENTRTADRALAYLLKKLLRYIDVLMVSPWKIELGEKNGYPLTPAKKIQKSPIRRVFWRKRF